jgi:gluconolactonase
MKILPFRVSEGGTEGPVQLPDGGIAFAARLANRVWKIEKDDKVNLLLENPGGALGMGVDAKGRLIAGLTAPPGKARIAVIYPKGQEAVLASTCDGVQINRPNDLVVSKSGGVYYTDPGPTDAEVKDGYAKSEGIVCYIAPGAGKAVKVAGNINRPNGIQLSPDEKTLYVNESYGDYLVAYDVRPDGTVGTRRNFAKYEVINERGRLGSGPAQISDGLAIDDAGRLYTTNGTVPGIQVISPQGQTLGTINMGRGAQNLAFGGPDKKTLYAVGGGYASKIPMLAQGIRSRPK